MVVDDSGNVQDIGYLDKGRAEARVSHLATSGYLTYVTPIKVWIEQEPTKTQYVFPPVPVLPPSVVFTPEPDSSKVQWAYEAPRRVFQQPVSLASAVSDAWTSWRLAQVAQGNLEAAALEPPEVAQLFEETPSGQLSLFPRDLA